jgi:integrase
MAGTRTALLAPLRADDQALWGTLLFAGMRLGEVRALEWDDIDLAAGTIRVNKSHADKPGATVTAPKSDKGKRTDVSRYLGHASIAITADIYGHAMDGSADAHRNMVA